MTLQSGTRLGPYEVLSPLGAGGMGEVYKARDTKLGRDVAIKILPQAFTSDKDRLARFDREARLLASLNHAHIGAIYGLEAIEGTPALVLELVDGDTLAERITAGPLPLADAVTIATQIADALEAAHERGIVHRDLKPANVKLTSGGLVKVLDFGLAKAATAGDESGADLSHSPTMTIGATREGMLLGTVAYMSPEQARGKPVDKRTDIWAFGCVLFEMLTGHAAFAGETVSDTTAKILGLEPAWESLPDATPPLIRRVLHRCLEKDLRRRVRDIADVRLEIEDALSAPVLREREASDRGRRWKVMLAVAALAVIAAAAGAIAWNLKPAASAPASVERFVITPTESLAEATGAIGLVAISPDGRRLAYVAGRPGQQQLYVRELDQFESRPIPGTERGHSPAFSPDGSAVAFVADRQLKKVAIGGGAPQTLVESMQGFGLSWGADDTILYNPGLATGIWRVSANGGTPTAVTTVGKELEDAFPEMLPNGKALLFNSIDSPVGVDVAVQSLETGQRRALLKGVGPHYLPTGHLVYTLNGTVQAVAFDPVRLEVTGAPVAMLGGVTHGGNPGAVQVSFSRTGSLVYVPAPAGSGESTLVLVDQAGVEHPTGAPGRPYLQPHVAPDGHRVAVTVGGSHEDVWEYDLARGTSSRLTDGDNSSNPLWTPDGRRLTFNSGTTGPTNTIYWKTIDGSGPAESLLGSDHPSVPLSWSPDGRVLAFVSVDPRTAQDIWLLNLDEKGGRKAQVFLETRFKEGAPVFSPDGKWLAYVSDESGRPEIYVRPVMGPGEKWTISAGGGNEPVWPRGSGGGQLFYRNGNAMMVVDVKTTPTFSAGKPRRLFEGPYDLSGAFWPNYDVTSDGKSLLMLKPTGQAQGAGQINVVLHWFDELKQKVPTK